MPVLELKGKTAIDCYHHRVPHHTLEFDSKLPVTDKGEERWLDGDLNIEGDNPMDTVTSFGSSGGGQ